MERISGVPAEHVLGRVAFDVFPFLRDTGEDDVFRRVLAGESVVNHERPYRVPETGRGGVYEGSYFPLRDASGAITGGMAIIRDVTDRKRTEAERAQLAREIAAREQAETAGGRFAFLADVSASLAVSLDYGTTLATVARLAVPALADWCVVYVVDRDGTLRDMGAAHVDPAKLDLVRRLQRSRASGNERPVARVVRTGKAELVPEVGEDRLARAIHVEDDRDVLRRLAPVSYMLVPIAVRGRTLGVIVFVSSESGRRFSPADLTFAEEVARRAGLAIENARLYEEAQELDRRKDELLAMLGHELRNPLGAIRTALQVVNHADTPRDEAARQRAIIDRQMGHVVRLVNDLLDVSRVMSGRIILERKRVDLNEVAQQCLLALRGDERAHEHELSLSVHADPVEVIGDPVRLEQLVFNLLDNALKYTPAGGRIEIAVRRDGGRGAIRVRDDGIGIDPEMLPHVFDLFMRGDASLARTRGGLGLGLTLVRKLVELHGGRVAVRSEGVNRGAEFVVDLPLAAEIAAPEPIGGVPGRRAVPPRRVLIIEDNPDARSALRALLEVWGHRVEVAEDGPRGFEAALAMRPDVVIVDIGLPGLDGYHVAQGLRAALGDGGAFLVALTGYGQPDDRRRALEAGFDVHLVKPVDPDVLAETLARVPGSASGVAR
jgi:PAS domain S-box-containing protein